MASSTTTTSNNNNTTSSPSITSTLRRSRSTGTISRLASLVSPTTVKLETKSTPQMQKEERLKSSSIFILVIISVLIRYTIALGPHSGENTPPMYGDYEAQRHWMEITINTVPEEWYKNTTNNDLNYWGLDYPPGSAYFAYFWGTIARFIQPDLVELYQSRGIETPAAKVFMRLSVIAADLLFYIPIALLIAFKLTLYKSKQWPDKFEMATFLLLNPAILLIDHGHFQYNGVSLGLCMAAILAYDKNYPNLCAMFFTLSLNFKQMNLYLALPFFFTLLSYSFWGGNGNMRRTKRVSLFILSSPSSLLRRLNILFQIAMTTIITFIIHWLPLCSNIFFQQNKNKDNTCSDTSSSSSSQCTTTTGEMMVVTNHDKMIQCKDTLIQMLIRLFPFNRGLFEDKVANIWCSIDPILKLKRRERLIPYLPMIAGICTLILSLPSAYALLRRAPTTRTFLHALSSTGLAFFLCSFQVHEKSILVPLLPIALLAPDGRSKVGLFVTVSVFSLYPLLEKDLLGVQYLVVFTAWIVLNHVVQGGYISRLILIGMVLIHLCPYVFGIIDKLPHLWILLNCIYSCGLFILFWIWVTRRMLYEC